MRNDRIKLACIIGIFGIFAASFFFGDKRGDKVIAGAFSAPVDGGSIVAKFGRIADGTERPHYAIGIAAPDRSPVRAAAAGRVVVKPEAGRVVIFHDGSSGADSTTYEGVDGIQVAWGQEVEAGEVLGFVNNRLGGRTDQLVFRVIDAQGLTVNPCRRFLKCDATEEEAAAAQATQVSFAGKRLDIDTENDNLEAAGAR